MVCALKNATGGVLSGKQIRYLIKKKQMLSNYIDLEKQLQTHGFDVTVESVYKFDPYTHGTLTFEGKTLPNVYEVKTDVTDCWTLNGGTYQIRLNEIVKLPKCICAVVLPRSSLIRMGCELHSALWDAGYEGRGVLLLRVNHPVIIKRNARIGQMVFFKLCEKVEQGYDGTYFGEGIPKIKAKCNDCGHEFGIAPDDGTVPCPKCGSSNISIL